MRLPLFRTTTFANLAKKSKKPASVSVRLTRATEDLFYVRKVQSSNEVIGYKDPQTGLFITKLRKDDTNSPLPHNQFRQLAWDYANEQVDAKLQELATLYNDDSDTYDSNYKSLAIIEHELSEYLADKQEFYIDLDKQVAVIRSNPRPNINEYMLFADDDVTDDTFATVRVPYNNPMRSTLQDEDVTIVTDFLSAFLDDYNQHVLAWYIGAALCNIPIYDERISKMLIVSSATGGSGKSTLMNALTHALFTDDYRDIKSSFDTFFLSSNRFNSSQLLPLRVIQYSEAEFNDATTRTHNFDGLNVSEIKSLISEGYMASEKKYDDMLTTRMASLQIVLTNNPPTIDEDRSALNRRLLALVVKPSPMAEKGLVLNMPNEQQVYQYVEEHRQAFANFFVSKFMENQQAFTNLDYNHGDTMLDIEDGQQEYYKSIQLEEQSLHQLSEQPVLTVIAELGRRKKLDVSALITDITFAMKNPKADNNANIRYDKNIVYISAKKDVFVKYNAIPLKASLQSVYGTPVKKYGQRMFALTGGESHE